MHWRWCHRATRWRSNLRADRQQCWTIRLAGRERKDGKKTQSSGQRELTLHPLGKGITDLTDWVLWNQRLHALDRKPMCFPLDTTTARRRRPSLCSRQDVAALEVRRQVDLFVFEEIQLLLACGDVVGWIDAGELRLVQRVCGLEGGLCGRNGGVGWTE